MHAYCYLPVRNVNILAKNKRVLMVDFSIVLYAKHTRLLLLQEILSTEELVHEQ